MKLIITLIAFVFYSCIQNSDQARKPSICGYLAIISLIGKEISSQKDIDEQTAKLAICAYYDLKVKEREKERDERSFNFDDLPIVK